MISRPVFTFAVVACGVIATSTVRADDYVSNADANGDGFVSLYELRAAHYADPEFNKRIEQSFAEHDRNGDGLISDSERRAVLTNHSNAAAQEETPAGYPEAELKMTGIGKASLDTVERTSRSGPDPGQQVDSPRVSASINGQRAAAGGVSINPTERWVLDIDADNSGGVSIAELVTSGGGTMWFTEKAFAAADRNENDELDSAELAVFMAGIERRQR